jgi:hypothetical protein|tara:strand:+ start:152 stop:457 length:306 start_codon:yes stop_codon:yes gene_type:complete
MLKKITYILLFIFLVSCAGTFDSVKRGLTGAKKSSADEFLVKKKDPLILPPDFENLPTPEEASVLLEESSIFENTLEDDGKADSPESKSVESSILKKIQSK